MGSVKPQVVAHEAGARGRPFTPGNAAEAGRRGAGAREANRAARLGECRQALEARAPEVASRLVAIALGEAVAKPHEVAAARDVLDRVLGQGAERLERIDLDAFEEDWNRLMAEWTQGPMLPSGWRVSEPAPKDGGHAD